MREKISSFGEAEKANKLIKWFRMAYTEVQFSKIFLPRGRRYHYLIPLTLTPNAEALWATKKGLEKGFEMIKRGGGGVKLYTPLTFIVNF